MFIRLPSDAVSDEITGTGLDFRVPLAKIFSESTNTRTKHSQFVFSGFERLVNISRTRDQREL